MLLLTIAVAVINAGYLLEGSFKPLGQYTFISNTLAGDNVDPAVGGNRFRGTWLADVPVPLPENYLSGIDVQKYDFEEGKRSYLNGEWKHGGWWYYYLEAAAVKVPLGIWLLFAVAVALSWCGRGSRAESRELEADEHRTLNIEHPTLNDAGASHPQLSTLNPQPSWRDTVVLLAPAVAVFVLVSSQTGFSRYFRYVLPCFPFVFIYISRVATVFGDVQGQGLRVEGRKENDPSEHRTLNIQHPTSNAADSGQGQSTKPKAPSRSRLLLKALIVGALTWTVFSSLMVYPHSMSYFNELAGGPKGGHNYLLHSNIDWGQDLWYLREWQDEHPEARPLHVDTFTFVEPDYYGIEYVPPPREPEPGWYAISIQQIREKHQHFLRLEPVAMAGYSIYIYHVTLDEANRLRAELGLAALDRDQEAGGRKQESASGSLGAQP